MFTLLAINYPKAFAVRTFLACRPFMDAKKREEAGKASKEMKYRPSQLCSGRKVVTTSNQPTDRNVQCSPNQTDPHEIPLNRHAQYSKPEQERLDEREFGRHKKAEQFVPESIGG